MLITRLKDLVRFVWDEMGELIVGVSIILCLILTLTGWVITCSSSRCAAALEGGDTEKVARWCGTEEATAMVIARESAKQKCGESE